MQATWRENSLSWTCASVVDEEQIMIAEKKLRELVYIVLLSLKVSYRQIARIIGVGHQTVMRIAPLIIESKLPYEDFELMDYEALKKIAYPAMYSKVSKYRRPPVDQIITALNIKVSAKKYRLKKVNYLLAYNAIDPKTALKRSRFYQIVAEEESRRNLSFSIQHEPGHILFIDLAGMSLPIWQNGVETTLYIFVARLGFSNKVFATIIEDKTTVSWIYALEKVLRQIGKRPIIVHMDNDTALVKKPSLVAELTDMFDNYCKHYRIIPDTSKPAAPKENSKAESAAKGATCRAIAEMRMLTFSSINEAEEELQRRIALLNETVDPVFGMSYEENCKLHELPMMEELNPKPFEVYKSREFSKSDKSYLVRVGNHRYSVPHEHRNSQVEVRYHPDKICIYKGATKIAEHIPAKTPGITYLPEHLHPQHKGLVTNGKDVYLAQASDYGLFTHQFMENLYRRVKNPIVCAKHCSAMFKMVKGKEPEFLEMACQYALEHNFNTFSELKLVLQAKPFEAEEQLLPSIVHQNQYTRGKGYFGGTHNA